MFFLVVPFIFFGHICHNKSQRNLLSFDIDEEIHLQRDKHVIVKVFAPCEMYNSLNGKEIE